MEKKLYRSTKDKALAGVCGGLGEYFGMDAVIVRLLWAVLSLCYGVGILIYIIAAIVIPVNLETSLGEGDSSYSNSYNSNSSNEQYSAEEKGAGKDNSVFLGILLIAIGAAIFVQRFVPWIDGAFIVAVGLIAMGGYFLFRQNGGEKDE